MAEHDRIKYEQAEVMLDCTCREWKKMRETMIHAVENRRFCKWANVSVIARKMAKKDFECDLSTPPSVSNY